MVPRTRGEGSVPMVLRLNISVDGCNAVLDLILV